MVRCEVEPPPVLESIVRHRAAISGTRYFLDGTIFDQDSQIRDVEIVFESPSISCHAVDGALLATTPEVALVLGPGAPPLLLPDLIENWLLWRAREEGIVMAHASGWVREGAVEMRVGASGEGKTTELLRQVVAGAEYFANDRVALRLEGDELLGRSFPEPINVGFGTIREVGLDLPTFDDDDRSAVRLRADEVLARWKPDFDRWLPVARILAADEEALQASIYWDGDPEHPFWNRALRPRALVERPELERAIRARVSIGS